MTDNDIIKALEYCFTNDWNRTKCDKCKFYTGTTQCVEDLKSASIYLINRQQVEIERLKCEMGKLLPKDCAYAVQMEVSNKLETQIRAEAVREFAERLKNKIKTECNPYGKPTFDYDTSIAIMRYIDNLVKEMEGEDNAFEKR